MRRAAGLRARLVLVIITSASIVAGAMALYWPTTLDDHDRWGFAISCGSGFTTDYDQATIADHDTGPSPQPQTRSAAGPGYVAKCQSAIRWRRGWATSLMVIGAVGLIALQFWKLRPSQLKASDE